MKNFSIDIIWSELQPAGIFPASNFSLHVGAEVAAPFTVKSAFREPSVAFILTDAFFTEPGDAVAAMRGWATASATVCAQTAPGEAASAASAMRDKVLFISFSTKI